MSWSCFLIYCEHRYFGPLTDSNLTISSKVSVFCTCFWHYYIWEVTFAQASHHTMKSLQKLCSWYVRAVDQVLESSHLSKSAWRTAAAPGRKNRTRAGCFWLTWYVPFDEPATSHRPSIWVPLSCMDSHPLRSALYQHVKTHALCPILQAKMLVLVFACRAGYCGSRARGCRPGSLSANVPNPTSTSLSA